MTLLNLIKQLFPTGRAFKIWPTSNFELLHDGINEPLEEWLTQTKGLYDQLLPDNDNFTIEDAAIWEVRLGLPGEGTFNERKLAISRKLNHPGNTLGRLSKSFFESQLQLAGFDVYVHENRFPDGIGGYMVINPGDGSGAYTQHGLGEHGISAHGTTGFPYDSICANHVDKTLEQLPVYTNDQLRYTIFIGAQQFPNPANVPARREEELRKLILTLKAQHIVCYLLINYN